MKIESDNEQIMSRYLLGLMDEDEELSFEERCFSDDASTEYLDAARDELIDRYVKGELSDSERESFNNYFLSSPYHRQKLAFAQSMMKAMTSPPKSAQKVYLPKESGWWKTQVEWIKADRRTVIGVSAAALLIIIGSILYWQSLNGSTPPKKIIAENNNTEVPLSNRNAVSPTPPVQANSHQQIEPPPSPSPDSTQKPQSAVVAFSLSPGLKSVEENRPLVIPGRAELIRFRVPRLAGNYSDYRATIRTVGGNEIWSGSLSTEVVKRNTVVIEVPAQIFSNDDYTLTISGRSNQDRYEDISGYYFRVRRE